MFSYLPSDKSASFVRRKVNIERHCAVIYYETWKISMERLHAQLPRLSIWRGLLCVILFQR